MILHHVAQRADTVIIGYAPFQPHGLAHRDLDMVDRGGIPQRLEHDIAEAQRQQVLDRFLAQIMVDAENLLFGEHRADAVIDLLGRSQVLADRLFHRDPRQRREESRFGQPLRGGREQGRGGGKIDRQAALQPPIDTLSQRDELLGLARLDRLIDDHLAKCRGGRGIIAIRRQELA